MTVHATAVAVSTRTGWRAALLRGPSGTGKSDLALRMISHQGWRLVGDDQVEVWRSGDALYVAPAPRLAGALEVRGCGLRDVPWVGLARVGLVVDCGHPADRLPEPDWEEIDGVRIARASLEAGSPSAPDRLNQLLIGHDARLRLEP